MDIRYCLYVMYYIQICYICVCLYKIKFHFNRFKFSHSWAGVLFSRHKVNFKS